MYIIYIYIYTCMCVCMCVYNLTPKASLNRKIFSSQYTKMQSNIE